MQFLLAPRYTRSVKVVSKADAAVEIRAQYFVTIIPVDTRHVILSGV